MGDRLRVLDAMLRDELASFIEKTFNTIVPGQVFLPNWHVQAIAFQLERVRRGEIRRLIITLPPRNLKSICASVAFPAFVMGHDPTARIVCVSYSADLAQNFARQSRQVISSDWYRRIFPGTRLSRHKQEMLDFVTAMEGYRFSTSVGGTLTGRGGNLIIIDDAMKPDDANSEVRREGVNEWFESTLLSRLDDKQTGAIVIIMQRLHMDDLVGRVMDRSDWVHLNLPAIAEADEMLQIGPKTSHFRRVGELLHPERDNQEVLEELKRSMGSYAFSAQYQQSPIPLEGEIWKWKWFRRYDAHPRITADYKVVQSWDTASKSGQLNDYSVCTTWLVNEDQEEYHLLDLYRERLEYPDLRRAVEALACEWKAASILVEDKGSGTQLIQDFEHSRVAAVGSPIAIEPEGDKVTRAFTQAAPIEAGRVLLPREADWLEDLRKEILQFPHGRHDDQVDSIAQFLKWERNRPKWATSIPMGFPY